MIVGMYQRWARRRELEKRRDEEIRLIAKRIENIRLCIDRRLLMLGGRRLPEQLSEKS